MNICFVVKDLYYGGGAYYDCLSRRLAKQGNRVWLISSIPKEADLYLQDGVHFVHVPIWRSAVPLTSLFRWLWRVARVLWRIEAEHGLDVVEFPAHYPEGLVYAYSRRRAAVAIRVHEKKTPVGLGWLWRDPRDAVREALCWLQLARADVILPVSDAVRDTCVRFLRSARRAKNIFTIRPGINTTLFAPTPLPPAPFRALAGKRIILFVGRITEPKGTYSLIEAFKDRIAARFGDTVLVVVGVPEEPDQLRRALEGVDGNVIHLDDVQTADLPAFYSHAYVFVGPSRNEGFGAVFVEALACGAPVISVAKGGPLEIVEHEVTGLLCPDNSPGSIAAALERLLSDRDLRDRMSRSARASVVDRFGMDRVASEVMERYHQAADAAEMARKIMAAIARSILPRRYQPDVYLHNLVVERTGMVVRGGCFAGLTLPAVPGRGDLWAKLLGTYERELAAVVEEAVALGCDTIINAGAAEGYYAVGLARRIPAAVVHAFEMDDGVRCLLGVAAALNDVTDRLAIKGKCEPGDLRDCLSPRGRNLIVCDVEGYESVLLDPARVPRLAQAHILVELHELGHRGIAELLRARFEGTHQIEQIWEEPRSANDYPFRTCYTRLLPERILLNAVNEWRSADQSWLWMRPR